MDIGAAVGETIPIVRDEFCDKFQKLFQDFLDEFRHGSDAVYVLAAKDLETPERNTLLVDFTDVETFSAELAKAVRSEFYRLYPCLCLAARNFAHDHYPEVPKNKDVFVSLHNLQLHHRLRDLTASTIGQLVRISGQVVRTHPVHPELIKGTFACVDCNSIVFNVEQEFKYTQPTKCSNPMCSNRTKFVLDVYRSSFVDFQKVRIQEIQAEVPRGCIPRSLEIVLRGENVEQAQPGDRFDFSGNLIVIPDVAQLSMPGAKAESSSRHKGAEGYDADGVKGLKALGVRELTYKMSFLACHAGPTNPRFGGSDSLDQQVLTLEKLKDLLEPEDLKKIFAMANDSNLYNNLCSSLFPSIYGNMEIKKGILLMLFGGVPKQTKEGITLRGDINVCLVGDPSTAKSNMLKQVEQFCPRAVYTSGKASTAAGLTAAVVKDEETSEFVIEAGALMLADNGVCCIDEFDKMEPHDQVAIHEAMEQQTISITKAGVKATLNARTSILAAANPIGGRYDRARSLRQNINMTAPILSRFDLFFILVDDCNEVTDYAIARRIVDLHRLNAEALERVYTVEDIQRYITFARLFKPKLTQEAADVLVEDYKRLRLRENTGGAWSSWRITVRQLESMVRLSEAMAKMKCSDDVTAQHVKEACRLLNKSIIRVEQPDIEFDDDEDDAILAAAAEEAEQAEMVATNGNGKETNDKRKLIITFEDYKRITNLLVCFMRQEESRKEDTNEDPGLKMSELIAWYLQEIQEQVESEQELLDKRTLVERIIDRLVKIDGIMIALSKTVDDVHAMETDETEKDEDPILVVHPNYVLEEE